MDDDRPATDREAPVAVDSVARGGVQVDVASSDLQNASVIVLDVVAVRGVDSVIGRRDVDFSGVDTVMSPPLMMSLLSTEAAFASATCFQ
jgi:hypothetical protein